MTSRLSTIDFTPRSRRLSRSKGSEPGGCWPYGDARRSSPAVPSDSPEATMIRKLKSGQYRLYSRKTDPKTGKRRNLGTFKSREAAEAHERAVQYFKRR